MLVNLLLLSVLFQQSSQNSDASHPQNLVRDTCTYGSLTLANAGVSSLTLGFLHSSDSGARMQMDVAFNYEAILEELSDVLA